MMTLYFAKLNLASEDLYNLYKDPKQKSTISFALYEAVNAAQHWQKEGMYKDDSGELHFTTTDYSLQVLNIDSTHRYIEGWVYKKGILYYKTLNNRNKLIPCSTESTEANRFVLDLSHGFIGYNTSNRFGYKEFIEAFENIINLGEEALTYNYRYRVSTCTRGLNLDEIKQELNSIGRIKELRIRMQPPNPNDELLDKLQQRCDGLIKDFQTANITEYDLLYSTKGTSGIKLDSPLISSQIDDIQSLYSRLSVEESTKKGYVSVEATSISGKKYSSGDSKPVKRVIENIDSFFHACVDAFHQLK